MNTRLGHGRPEAPARGPALPLLTILLLAAVSGCGTRQAEQTTAGRPAVDESSPKQTVIAVDEAPATAPRRTGSVLHVNLTDRGCVRFEPQWTNVRVGQSVAWHSDLEAPVTIYVSPGVFARDHFVVRPGATVNTGPARAPGRYSFWTEPSACREAPRGVLMAGPGVMVRETFYASAPGVR